MLHHEIAQLAAALPDCRVVTAVSDEPAPADSVIEHGLVTEVVRRQVPDPGATPICAGHRA
jgi:hypothetical protein